MKKLAAPPLRQAYVASLCLFLAACGGVDQPQQEASAPATSVPASVPPTVPPTVPPVVTYTIGGTVTGLGSGSLALLDNGANTLTLQANGPFTFTTPVAFNNAYSVTVGTQPLWQTCSVANGSGTATANVTNVAISCAAAQAMVSTLAGSGTVGSANGTGTAATFNKPEGVAVDASGNVYVGDRFNDMIRMITPAGVVSTLAGSSTPGTANGTGTAASFDMPSGVAVDASGNVYVADTYGNKIRKITPAGVVSTLAGSGTVGSADGTGTAASFDEPYGVAVDASGNVYVADTYGNKIRKVTPAGVVSTVAGSGTAGSANGTGTAASFNKPFDVAVDASGNLYVADGDNNEIRMITQAGVVSTLAGSGTAGSANGTGTAASFNQPFGVAVDASGNVYVGDASSNEIRMITPAGVVSTLAGSGTAGSANGTGTAASFNSPTHVAVDAGGNVYVGDWANSEIRKISPAP
ncbi:NHL repeat-containing protein [Paraburkholderia polaris]|nr:NHL repeat-containing protein [Paraburkholderia polaris]